MNNLSLLMDGFATILTWNHLMIMVIGVMLGMLVGVLPGLGALNGVSLLLPLTFTMDPVSAIILLSCMYWGALFGGSTTVSGTLLISDNFVANIVAECTAIGPIILYIGAVVAYPASKRAKLAGVAAGAVVLTAVNLVRIISLFWIGEAYPEYLDVAHLLVWQSAIILLAIIMWLLWAGRLSGAAQR